jgi:hypothetical protein
MFSALMVTRTFLRLTIGTPLARRLGWWVADLAEVRAAVAMASAPGAGPPLAEGMPAQQPEE